MMEPKPLRQLRPLELRIPDLPEIPDILSSRTADLDTFPDLRIIPTLTIPKPKGTSKQYKDDWRICYNCGLYYIEPHTCTGLRRKLDNDPSQSHN